MALLLLLRKRGKLLLSVHKRNAQLSHIFLRSIPYCVRDVPRKRWLLYKACVSDKLQCDIDENDHGNLGRQHVHAT